MSEGFIYEGPPEITEVPIEQARIEPVHQRMAPMMAALEQRGMTVHDFFGGNEPRIDASISRGDWGQDDRGFEHFIPAPPPIPGTQQRQERAPQPQFNYPESPQYDDYGFVDARAQTTPYQDAGMGQQPPQEPAYGPPQPRVAMTRDDYLRMTGNAPQQPGTPGTPGTPDAPPMMFGQPRTPQETFQSQEIGALRNQLGELKDLVLQSLSASGNASDPFDSFAKEIGLDEFDPDQPLTPKELKQVLGRFGGSMYNTTKGMVSAAASSQTTGGRPNVDPRVEAVKAQMVARYPWLGGLSGQAQDVAIADMLGSGQGGYQQPIPPTPQGSQTVQHHQRPATFVERGTSITQQDMQFTGRRKPRDAYDLVMEKKQRGEHVTTKELGEALRARGMNVPIRH